MPIVPKCVLCWLIAGALLGGCSSGDEQSRNVAATASAREFTDQEKRAARTLSISQLGTPPAAGSAYDKAILCSIALESLAVRFGDLEALNQEQVRALSLARNSYERQARALGNERGRSAEELRTDRQRVATENSDQGARLRTAIGCLQSLQGA